MEEELAINIVRSIYLFLVPHLLREVQLLKKQIPIFTQSVH